MSDRRTGSGPDLLDTERLEELLTELAAELSADGVNGRVYLVGGAALAIAYYDEGDRRLTNDVDAALYPADVIAEVAQRLAEKHGLRAGWLNDKAARFLPAHGQPDGTVVIERDLVTICVAPPRLLLAMKLRAARLGRDDDDIAVLIRRCDVRTVEQAKAVLDEVYDGEEHFKPIAHRIVEAALGEYVVKSGRPTFVLDAMPPP